MPRSPLQKAKRAEPCYPSKELTPCWQWLSWRKVGYRVQDSIDSMLGRGWGG